MHASQRLLKLFKSSSVLAAEKLCLAERLACATGYYLLLLGTHRNLCDLPSHRLYAMAVAQDFPVPDPLAHLKNTAFIQARYEALPFRNNSIDAIVAPYLLDAVYYPRDLLSRLYSSLVAGGDLFIFGCHRWHPWCWFHAPRKKYFVPLCRLKHWLRCAQFKIVSVQALHYGALYFIHAKKNVYGVTPLRLDWQKESILPKEKPLINPVTRE